MVLLHGFSGNVTNFTVSPVWRELGKTHNLLSFDRPGWGLSPRVLQNENDGSWPTASGLNPYTYEYSAFLLREVLKSLGLWGTPMIVLGHSHGGMTTAFILSNYADLRAQFRAAILVDAPLDAWPIPKVFQNMAVKNPRMTRFIVQHCVWMYRAAARTKPGVGFTFYDVNAYLERFPNGMMGWDQTFRVKGWKRSFAEWSVANAKRPVMDLSNLRELPTLDIRGLQDRVIDVSDGFNCAARTGAEIAYIDHAGHLPFAEQPEEFLAVVRTFIEKISDAHSEAGGNFMPVLGQGFLI